MQRYWQVGLWIYVTLIALISVVIIWILAHLRFPVTEVAFKNPYIVVPQEAIGHVDLFIMAGQSNMTGYAPLYWRVHETNPRILTFGNDYRWHLAQDPVDDATNQVDWPSEDPLAGIGPGIPFAQEYLKQHPQAWVALIPCSRGATSLNQWERNRSDQTLYGACLKRIRAAEVMGTVRGLLFYEGESDSEITPRHPSITLYHSTWAQHFTQLIQDFRQDLGNPNLPVVFAQIGRQSRITRKFLFWHTIQAQQSSVRLPNVKMITTMDLPLGDAYHLSAQGYEIAGARFGKAMNELTRQSP